MQTNFTAIFYNLLSWQIIVGVISLLYEFTIDTIFTVHQLQPANSVVIKINSEICCESRLIVGISTIWSVSKKKKKKTNYLMPEQSSQSSL